MRRPILILYILAFYVIFQFCWWAYLLLDLNVEIYEHRIENVRLSVDDKQQQEDLIAELEERNQQRHWMVLGEGGVFLGLLIWGSFVTLRSIRKEVGLARQQKNFLLSITHEFKSPLASIKLYLQTLQRHDLDADREAAFIQGAINDTERLNNLVENALLANLIDHNGYSFNKEELNLSAFIRLLLQKLPGANQRNRIDGQIEDGISIFADRNAISVLFSNLLENAVKYSPADSPIRTELTHEGTTGILRVIDQGNGIPDAEKKNVFRKFYRLGKEETRKTKGTGLGLYICKYITDEHKGTIRVLDNSPWGSIFEVRFPLLFHHHA